MNLELEHELNTHLMQLQDVLHEPKPPQSVEEHLSNHLHNPTSEADQFELEHQVLNSHLMQDVLHDPSDPSLEGHTTNWDINTTHDMMMNSHQYHHHHLNNHDLSQQIDLQCFNSSTPLNNSNPPYAVSQTPTPDLLSLFHLPRYSLLPNSSISFTNPSNNSNNNNNKPGSFPTSLDFFGGGTSNESNVNGLYDSALHLDLPPQQTPIFKELFHSLPYGSRGVGVGGGGGSTSFFGGIDEREHLHQGKASLYQEDGRQFENSVLEFGRDMNGLVKGEDHGKGTRQHFATERQRREQLNSKYKDLRQLVPNPTKGDRASIVHDAIEYIKELLRTVDELKILVDKKRYGRERTKKLKTEDEEAAGDVESSSMKPLSTLTEREQSNGTRASWLRRKSKETEVDVRIIEDEVTIKLIQRKKMNCLLSVSKILDELQLDLLHVSGGNIGETYCFLFNTKIYEGSSVYARAIANKLIEAVDKNYSTFQPGSF